MTQLLPCPFCGGTPLLAQRSGWWEVECKCNVTLSYRESEQDVCSAWNRRAAAPERDGGPEWTCAECASRGPFTGIEYSAGDADLKCDECGSLDVRESAAEAFRAHVLAEDAKQAAAPELLSVVERLVRLHEQGEIHTEYDGDTFERGEELIRDAKAALTRAKAGGGT